MQEVQKVVDDIKQRFPSPGIRLLHAAICWKSEVKDFESVLRCWRKIPADAPTDLDRVRCQRATMHALSALHGAAGVRQFKQTLESESGSELPPATIATYLRSLSRFGLVNEVQQIIRAAQSRSELVNDDEFQSAVVYSYGRVGMIQAMETAGKQYCTNHTNFHYSTALAQVEAYAQAGMLIKMRAALSAYLDRFVHLRVTNMTALVLMQAYLTAGQPQQALRVYSQLKSSAINPSGGCLAKCMASYRQLGQPKLALSALHDYRQKGSQEDAQTKIEELKALAEERGEKAPVRSLDKVL